MRLSPRQILSSASCGIPKSSGLFDIGSSDVVSENDLKTIDSSELFSTLHRGRDDPRITRSSSINSEIGAFIDDLKSKDPFSEEFMDLSSFLFTDNEETPINTTMIASKIAPKNLKRQAVDDDIGNSDTLCHAPNPDHCDYTSKRPRLVSSAESEVSSDNDAGIHHKGRKYVERRKKNNIASKRSRETRKQKYINMEEEAVKLETENKDLEVKVREMEVLTKKMKDILVKRMAGKLA